MGGNALPMLEQIGGTVLGVLSALPSRGGGFANLANYMARREALMADPNARATLTGSPFTGGYYMIGGGMQPGPAQLAATPAPPDFMGPTIPTTMGPAQNLFVRPGQSVWTPDLPPLAPEQALQQTTQQATLAGIQSPDIGIRTQAKLVAKIPLTADEQQAAIAAGTQQLKGAPPGSQVVLDLPGGRIAIGSPYAPYTSGIYQTYGEAAAAGAASGTRPIPAPGGGWTLGPRPSEGEYATQAEAAAVRNPNEQTQPTGRGTWQNVKVEQKPITLPPLSTTPQPPATPAAAPAPQQPAATQPAAAPAAPVQKPAAAPPPSPPKPAAAPPAAAAPSWDPNATLPHVIVPEPPQAAVGFPSPAFGGEAAAAAPAPPPPPAPPAGALSPTAFVQGMMQRGWTPAEAAAAAGNVHAESAFRPGVTEQAPLAGRGGYGLLQWTGPRRAALERFAAATGRNVADPETQMDWLHLERTGQSTQFGGTDERAAFQQAFAPGGNAQDMAARFGQHVERPADLSATVAQRRGVAGQILNLFAPASAEAAEVPPGAVPVVPQTGLPPSVTVPVWRVPAAAPLPPPVVPPAPPAPPAAVIGPGGTTLEGVSQTSQAGETRTWGLPNLGDVETQLAASRLKIRDLRTMTPEQSIALEQEINAERQRRIAAEAEARRLTEGTTGEERASNELLLIYRNRLNALDQQFSDADQQAHYLDPNTKHFEALKGKFRSIGLNVEPDPGFTAFHEALAPFSAVDPSKLDAREQALLRDAPTGQEDSLTQFQIKKQNFSDNLNDIIAWRLATQNLPRAQLTDQVWDSFMRNRQDARAARLAAPAPPATAPVPTATAAPPPPPPAPAAEPWQPLWVR